MNFIAAVLLAISLSMDALGIGLSYGLRTVAIAYWSKVIISLISLLFMALAIAIGNVITLILSEFLSKLIGAGMLLLLGVTVIIQTLRKNKKTPRNKQSKKEKVWSIKAFGYCINITRQTSYDKTYSKSSVNVQEALYLGVALSIDSFGVGISSAIAGLNHILIPVLVGICQFLFLSIGLFCGRKLTTFKRLDSNVFMLISGIILVALATVRFFL